MKNNNKILKTKIYYLLPLLFFFLAGGGSFLEINELPVLGKKYLGKVFPSFGFIKALLNTFCLLYLIL